MSPQPITEPRLLARHPQRPWRPVGHEPQRPARTTARTFCAPVVRELPPRREHRAASGGW
jgi:hypothetical protein